MRALGSPCAAVVPNWTCQVWGEGWGWTAEEHREGKKLGMDQHCKALRCAEKLTLVPGPFLACPQHLSPT